jgi:hypothetical protein
MNPERRTYEPHQLFSLALALNKLSEAFLAHDDAMRVDIAVEGTLRHLNEFVGETKPAPTLNEVESNFYRAAHTYMRKGMDGPLASLLYNSISSGRGEAVWRAFVKGAVEPVKRGHSRYRNGLRAAEDFHESGVETPEGRDMLCLLELWGEEDFDIMIDAFKQDDWGVQLT